MMFVLVLCEHAGRVLRCAAVCSDHACAVKLLLGALKWSAKTGPDSEGDSAVHLQLAKLYMKDVSGREPKALLTACDRILVRRSCILRVANNHSSLSSFSPASIFPCSQRMSSRLRLHVLACSMGFCCHLL